MHQVALIFTTNCKIGNPKPLFDIYHEGMTQLIEELSRLFPCF